MNKKNNLKTIRLTEQNRIYSLFFQTLSSVDTKDAVFGKDIIIRKTNKKKKNSLAKYTEMKRKLDIVLQNQNIKHKQNK